MSTNYIPDNPLDFSALRAFKRRSVQTHSRERNRVILTDGKNYLAAYRAVRGHPLTFERTGENDVSRIIRAVEKEFTVRLVSEYDDCYATLFAAHDVINRHRAKNSTTLVPCEM